MECIPSKKHICNICNKEYTTRQNLWKHNKNNHTIESNPGAPIITNNTPEPEIITPIITNNTPTNECKYCKNIFSRVSSLKRHYDRCKIKNDEDNKIKKELEELKIENKRVKEETEIFKKEMAIMKKQMLEIMNKQNKIHPKTLTKINKQLNNNTLNDNKVINNNNINIIALGGESLDTLFSKNQQISILNHKYQCLPHLIKEVHFNDSYPQFKNILITNTQNTIAYKYDNNEKKFIAIDKNDLLEDIILERMGDIETFYDNTNNELDARTKNIIQTFIDKMDTNEEYKENKKKEIKLIIYNNRNKVSKEITQDLEVIV